MLKTVRLNLLPGVATECIAWSADGCLSILAYTEVIVLVPKFRIPNSHVSIGKRQQQFHHTKASVRNLNEEVKVPEPAHMSMYSIGEELGPGYARQVAWSPLGTSRFKRCMMAVLTTALMVVIFEPVGHPALDWTLKYDLTKIMRKQTGDAVARRLRSRARAVAWSSACGEGWGQSLLAVTNDYLEIELFRANYEAVERLATYKPFEEDYVKKRIGKKKTFLENVSWSPWVQSDDRTYYAAIAFSCDGEVLVQQITMNVEDGKQPTVTVKEGATVIGKAPSAISPIYAVTWSPEELQEKRLLAYATQRRVTVVEFDRIGNKLSSHDYSNDFIEPTAGLCFTPSSVPGTISLQHATCVGRTQSITHPPTDTSIVTDDNTHWATQVKELEADFMGDHDLPTGRTRLFGLTASPLGNFIVSAVSFHPDDQIEYITAALERVAIVFGTHEASPVSWDRTAIVANKPLPTSYDMSVEALLIELTGLGQSVTARLQSVVKGHHRPPSLKGTPEITPSYPSRALSYALLRDSSLNSLRYSLSLDLLSAPLVAPKDSPDIILASVYAILRSPHTADLESKRILYSLACVGVISFGSQYPQILHAARDAFNWLNDNTPETTRFDLELSLVSQQLKEVTSGQQSIGLENGLVSSMEKCVLCGEGVVWRDVRIVECTQGHRFTRCAVTFLPVVSASGVAECGVCGRTMLVLGDEGLAGEVKRAWDVCLQCGGRYWCPDDLEKAKDTVEEEEEEEEEEDGDAMDEEE